MSIAELGFKICLELYQKLPAIVFSTMGTYGAARYISILNLPTPQASAKFTAILAVAFTITHVFKRELKRNSKTQLREPLSGITLYTLVAYSLYARANPASGLWPFAKVCTVALGLLMAGNYFIS